VIFVVRRDGMKRIVVLSAVIMAVCLLPWVAYAQGFAGFTRSLSSTFSPPCGTESCNVCGFPLTIDAKAGYMSMGLNFNLPTLPPGFLVLGAEPGSVDLQVRGTGYWMGAVGLMSQITPNFSLSLSAEGNLKKTATALTPDNDLAYTTTFFPLTWEASKFQWWAIDARAAYKISSQCSILGGFKVDQVSFTLRNPVDALGNPVNFNESLVLDSPPIFVSGAFGESVAGDFQGKLWVPYVGLQVDGGHYRGSIIWSPVAWAKVTIPNRFSQLFSVNAQFNDGEVDQESSVSFNRALNLRYLLKKPGTFLEGQFEYDWHCGGAMFFQLWAKASWLKIRGGGTMEAQGNLSLQQSATFNGTTISDSFAESFYDSDNALATYTRYSISGGIGAVLNF
jgi:hypothetical protein